MAGSILSACNTIYRAKKYFLRASRRQGTRQYNPDLKRLHLRTLKAAPLRHAGGGGSCGRLTKEAEAVTSTWVCVRACRRHKRRLTRSKAFVPVPTPATQVPHRPHQHEEQKRLCGRATEEEAPQTLQCFCEMAFVRWQAL